MHHEGRKHLFMPNDPSYIQFSETPRDHVTEYRYRPKNSLSVCKINPLGDIPKRMIIRALFNAVRCQSDPDEGPD
jgi:hypothetical protein